MILADAVCNCLQHHGHTKEQNTQVHSQAAGKWDNIASNIYTGYWDQDSRRRIGILGRLLCWVSWWYIRRILWRIVSWYLGRDISW